MRTVALAALALGMLAVSPQPMNMRLDGHWEIVRGRGDGRFQGASVRTFHPGDVLAVTVNGSGFRIYGVTGPTGGHAVVVMQNTPISTIDFYSPQKRTDVLLYSSPPFRVGQYAIDLVVSPIHDARSRGTYVNIDKVEVVR